MFRVEEYLHRLIDSMKDEFGDRLLYVGLQGSYLRDEATENSDIDIMVIIKKLSVQDLDLYRKIISQMEGYEKSCGFICGVDEFSGWNPLELFHILHSTKDCYGKLSQLIPEYEEQDIYYLKTGVFCLTKKELLNMLNESDKEIMELSLKISEEEFSDFEQAFEKLFLWCQKALTVRL